MTRCLLAGVIVGMFSVGAFAQQTRNAPRTVPPAAPVENPDARKRDEVRVDLERRRVEADERRTKLDELNYADRQSPKIAWVTAVSSAFTAGGILLGGGFAFWRFRRDHVHGLTLKALELAMDGASGKRVGARLRLMQELVPDLKEITIPSDAELSKAKLGSSLARKQELIALLAAHPTDRRQTILEDWHGAFPSDRWIQRQGGTLVIKEPSSDSP